MFSEKTRYGQNPNVVVRSNPVTFNAPLRWAKNTEKYPDIKYIFVDSWSDFFIEEADPWREEAWDIMRRTPQFIYQLCTKRAERIADCLPPDWGGGYENVWLMTSTENQESANKRIPLITRIPAVVHGISAEPLLEEIHVESWLHPPTGINWVIGGCESGVGSRDVDDNAFRSLRDQCSAAGVPYFLKQMKVNGKLVHSPLLDGREWKEFPKG
jgi:protein gp37